MTADWTIAWPDPLAPSGKGGLSRFGWTLSGRARLTGAALYAPRTVEFSYGPGPTTVDDRWRLAIGDRLIWLEDPEGVVTYSEAGQPQRVDRHFDGLLRHPAPEVVSLRSLATAAARLDVAAPDSPSGQGSTGGRAILRFEVDVPRRCRFVVDEETGFVLNVTAEGERGPHTVTVDGFTVRPMPPSGRIQATAREI